MNGLGPVEQLNVEVGDAGVESLGAAPEAERSHVECLRVAHCDAQARLRRLVDTQLDFVWRYLRRMGQCAADCDEIVQEAVLVVARRLDGVREGCERSYLLKVAINIASTRRRSFSRELVRIDRSAETYVQEPPPDPEQAIEVREARQQLDSILAAMPLELRTVFVLYEIEEQNTREIAELLELKEGTVASRLRRARAEFRQQLERRALPPTPLRPTPPARIVRGGTP